MSFLFRSESTEAANNHKTAKTELANATRDAVANHGGQETDRYVAANDRVVATETRVSWFRR
jgi:hypothetical protein